MKMTMNKLLVAATGLFCSTAVLADFDGSVPLTCSFAKVIECDYGAKCELVINESVDAPDFVELDFKKKIFVAISGGMRLEPGDINSVEDLENHLIAQGIQGTRREDPLGWSLSINQETGRAVFALAGDNAGFVVFGACAPE